MAVSPKIPTERLVLVPFDERHLSDRYVGWLNDSGIMRYSEQRHRRHTLEGCREYWQSFRETPNFFWAIELKEGGVHIGNMNAYVDTANQLADLGILIGEKGTQGKGVGGEAWEAACAFLFIERNIRKITAGTLAVNKAMCALAHRAGMVADGVRHRHYLWEGQEMDVVHFALFRDQWEQRQLVRQD